MARIGMTETEARAAGHRVRVGERRMDHVSRAVEKSEGTRGLMRLVVDADDDRILGAAILVFMIVNTYLSKLRGSGRLRSKS